MVTEEYKSNSNKSKEAQRKEVVKKVVSGNVKAKKKTALEKAGNELGLSSFKSVANYILKEVLIPALKKMISEMVSNGTDMILFGETQKESKRKTNGSYISYSRYYDDKRERAMIPVRTSVYDFDDIEFDDYADADEVLSSMDEIISQYRILSVSDFYELCGLQGDYTDNKYGWTDIENARILRTRDGKFVIKMPKAMPLNA